MLLSVVKDSEDTDDEIPENWLELLWLPERSEFCLDGLVEDTFEDVSDFFPWYWFKIEDVLDGPIFWP